MASSLVAASTRQCGNSKTEAETCPDERVSNRSVTFNWLEGWDCNTFKLVTMFQSRFLSAVLIVSQKKNPSPFQARGDRFFRAKSSSVALIFV